jgi:hypothetical protein
VKKKHAAITADGWYACPDGHSHRFQSGAARCLCGAYKSQDAGERVYPTHGNYTGAGVTFRQKPLDPKCNDANLARLGVKRR